MTPFFAAGVGRADSVTAKARGGRHGDHGRFVAYGFAGDVIGEIADQIGIQRSNMLRRRGVQCCMRAGVIEQAAPVQVCDVGLVIRPAGQPGLCPGANDIGADFMLFEFCSDSQREAGDRAFAGWIAGAAVITQERH